MLLESACLKVDRHFERFVPGSCLESIVGPSSLAAGEICPKSAEAHEGKASTVRSEHTMGHQRADVQHSRLHQAKQAGSGRRVDQ